jgi:hypothetical protein
VQQVLKLRVGFNYPSVGGLDDQPPEYPVKAEQRSLSDVFF